MKPHLSSSTLWLVLAAVAFLPFLGGVHLFDWDEINFAEIAREMVVTGDWLKMQINYVDFTEKPPLFFWLQAVSMKIWGVGEYAARFPNAVLGMVVLPGLFQLGKKLGDAQLGAFWALAWFGSILPFLYFKSGIIDPLFNVFIFIGIIGLMLAAQAHHRGERKTSVRWILIAGTAVGLGILTKGPVAFLLVFLTVIAYTAFNRFRFPMPFIKYVGFSFTALGVFLLWFAIDWAVRGPEFLIEFTIRQWELLTTGDAGHSGFLGYHVVVLFFGCFPASILAISGLRRAKNEENTSLRDLQKWMIFTFWVVLILFSLVGTKIIHYSSMAYYPITFLAAYGAWRVMNGKTQPRAFWKWTIAVVGGLIVVISAALPYIGMHPEIILPLMEADPFASANMGAEVNWGFIDFLPAIIMAATILWFTTQWKTSFQRAYKGLFFGTAIWVFAALIHFVAKVESISQRASVTFFEEQVDEQVYVTTYGYKSYVPWFYARVMPGHEKAADTHWLLYEETDRPVRISVKVNKVEEFQEKVPDAQLLYAKNGFYFFERPGLSK